MSGILLIMIDDPEVLLTTLRLVLRLPKESDGAKLEEFEKANVAQLSPWRTTLLKSEPEYIALIRNWQQEFAEGRSIRFLLFLKENPDGKVLGLCNFTQIFRGPFQACYLGYQIDSSYERRGLMSEAIERAIEYMFGEQNIHRIMANYMPSNERSGRLLRKLDFVIEGTAKNYLRINGRWEDHVLTSLTNPNWLPAH